MVFSNAWLFSTLIFLYQWSYSSLYYDTNAHVLTLDCVLLIMQPLQNFNHPTLQPPILSFQYALTPTIFVILSIYNPLISPPYFSLKHFYCPHFQSYKVKFHGPSLWLLPCIQPRFPCPTLNLLHSLDKQ